MIGPVDTAVVSTYGVLCGIATYSSELTYVTNFKTFSESPVTINHNPNLIGYLNPNGLNRTAIFRALGNLQGAPLLWWEHEGSHNSGINPLPIFIEQLSFLHDLGVRLYVTPHSIHFEENTNSGMRDYQEALIQQAAPIVDKFVFLSDGAYDGAVALAPRYRNKFDVLYHGVQDYFSLGSKGEIRNKFFGYYGNLVDDNKRKKLTSLKGDIEAKKAVWIGSFGFLNKEKTQYLPQLRKDIEKLLGCNVYMTYVGGAHPKADPTSTKEIKQLLGQAALEDDRFIFIDDNVPEKMLPYVVGSPDLSCLYEPGGTQSGRLSHAVGFPSMLIVANNKEGIGQMWEMLGYRRFIKPSLAETTAGVLELIVLEKAEELYELELRRRALVTEIGWSNQGKKHIRLAKNPHFDGTDIGLYDVHTSIDQLLEGHPISRPPRMTLRPHEIVPS